MSIIEELDAMMSPFQVPFYKPLNADQWYELFKWCDEQFEKQYYLDRNTISFKNEEHATLFALKWK